MCLKLGRLHIDYDLNGNITNLYRSSVIESGNTATVIDRLEYFYASGNKSNTLDHITDYQNNPSGYEGGSGVIHHDANGNMDKMQDKNIESIAYNYLNLPHRIVYGGGFKIESKYNASGIRLQKKVPRTECGIMNCTFFMDTTDYLDGFQYLTTTSTTSGGGGGGGSESESMRMAAESARAFEIQAYSLDNGSSTSLNPATLKDPDLQFFPTSEGFYDYKKDQYIYQYRDHLGNTRISFARNSAGALEIVDVNDYYPFGMSHLKSGTAMFGQGSYKNYKYNGKELQETGMYDYGARMYMADIGRWGVVDPLAETSRRWSTYNYAYNNPVRFIDPDGRQAEDKIKIFSNGKIERTKDSNIFDTFTNEDESKSIQIARTNVSESNSTGDSQIGEAKTVPYSTNGHENVPGGTEFTYMQIQDYDVATQVFEFSANNASVEFGQDTFSFNDGFSTNIVGTNHSTNESASAADILENNNLGGSGFHITRDATREERVHSHPAGITTEVGPSGFDAYRDKKTGKIITSMGMNGGDRKAYNSNVKNVYQYTPGVGYFRYNNKTSTYIGNTKK